MKQTVHVWCKKMLARWAEICIRYRGAASSAVLQWHEQQPA